MTEIVVFSGGTDSFLNVYKLLKENLKPRLFYVNFEKPASFREMAAAKRLCNAESLQLEVVPFPAASHLQNGYIDPTVVLSDEMDIKGAEIASEYGPNASGFHMVLSLAAYYAQITRENSITIGVILEQTKKEDKLARSFKSFEDHVSLLNPTLEKFSIKTPLINLTKAEVIIQATELGVPLQYSWSCLYGGLKHCGVCSQCVSRKKAFENAETRDPTDYFQ